METQCKRKPQNDFSYMSLRITFIGSINFIFVSICNWKEVPTPYISGLQSEGNSNSPILWLQVEGGYNLLYSLANTRRWLQPPTISLYIRLGI